MVLAHPIWWVKFLIFVGMILIFLQGVSEVMKIVSTQFGRKTTTVTTERGNA